MRKIAKTAPNLAFQMDLEDDLSVQADQILLEELIYILLKNAVTYTPEGTIVVRAKDKQTSVEIAIEDTGIGISKEDLPFIFERFYRADKVRTSSGTGLGLSIAKIIVELHDGMISVESEIEKGSIFTVYLPKK